MVFKLSVVHAVWSVSLGRVCDIKEEHAGSLCFDIQQSYR